VETLLGLLLNVIIHTGRATVKFIFKMWKLFVVIRSLWLATLSMKQSMAADGQYKVLPNGVMHTGLYLPDSVFKHLGDTNQLRCVMQCMMHTSCVAINHHADKRECELLNRDVASSLYYRTVSKEGYITSDIKTWPKVIFNKVVTRHLHVLHDIVDVATDT
jgi:hypothetical protein